MRLRYSLHLLCALAVWAGLCTTTWATDTTSASMRRITSSEAYALWRNAPMTTFVVDVRTPEEYALGHPPMAANIPILLHMSETRHQLVENQNFIEEIRQRYKPTDRLLILCRTNNRSLLAANRLAATGFSNGIIVADGVEGRNFGGNGPHNGWRNQGLPWTTHMDGKLIYKPTK